MTLTSHEIDKTDSDLLCPNEVTASATSEKKWLFPKPFHAYPIAKHKPFEKEFVGRLCAYLGFTNKDGKLNSAFREAVSHVVGSYRFVALKSKSPSDVVFRYSRDAAYLMKAVSGLTMKVPEVIDALEQKGLIQHIKASPRQGRGDGIQSKFCFTESFMQLTAELMKHVSDPLEQEEDYGPISHDSPKVRTKLYKQRYAKAVKLRPSQMHMERLLTRHENLLNSSNLGLEINTLVMDITWLPEGRMLEAKLKAFDTDQLKGPHRLYRQFSDIELKTHGRLYGGGWQNIPSCLRPYLTINANPTCEVDFVACHPSILFSLAKEKPVRDPYIITTGDGRLIKGEANYPRSLMKMAFMFMSNGSPKYWLRSLRQAATEGYRDAIEAWSEYFPETEKEITRQFDEIAYILEKGFLDQMKLDVEREWASIFPFIYKNSWAELMKIDSDINMEIIKSLTQKGIVVLSIHDSFVVECRHKELLKTCMVESYMKILRLKEGDYVPALKVIDRFS